MRSKLSKMLRYIGNETKYHIKQCKSSLILLAIAVALGLVVGIIACSISEAEYSSINYVVLLGKDEYNIFGHFFRVLLLSFTAVLLIYLSSINKWCGILPYGVLFYTAYRFGIRLLYTIMSDKLLGVICVCIYVVPMYLLLLLSFVVATCMVKSHIAESGYYRRCARGCRQGNVSLIKRLLLVFCVISIGLVILELLMPFIVKFIVII